MNRFCVCVSRKSFIHTNEDDGIYYSRARGRDEISFVWRIEIRERDGVKSIGRRIPNEFADRFSCEYYENLLCTRTTTGETATEIFLCSEIFSTSS